MIIDGGYDGWDEEDDWGVDADEATLSPIERAKEILVQLESDDDLLKEFNFLLRQKKLKQLKDK